MKQADSNYKAWSVNETAFPHDGSLEQKIWALTNYGVLAPSTHNTQPWQFGFEGGVLRITPDPTKRLPIGDPEGWGTWLSLGMCTENIVQAGVALGVAAQVASDEKGVSLSCNARRGGGSATTLTAITERVSNKFPYQDRALPNKLQADLEALSGSGCQVRIISGESTRHEITQNHVRAARSISANPAFGRELAGWLRSNGTKAFDGMPGFVVGSSSLQSVVGKTLLKKKPRLLQKLVAKDKQLLDSAPAFAVVSITGQVSPTKLVAAGQLIERVWLKLTQEGLSAHPLFAAIQDPASRQQLAGILSDKGTPVFFMRLGYATRPAAHTPRALPDSSLEQALAEVAGELASHPRTHSLQVGNYHLNYVQAGKGKPVLLLHGANIGWPQWHLNIDELAKHFTVYALDLPGAGGSTKVDFSKMDFENDYVKIVDQFIVAMGWRQIDIVGSSFGGWIAMRLAMQRRPYFHKLVLANPIGFTQHMPVQFRPISLWPFAVLMSKTALKPVRSNKRLEAFMRDVFYKKNLPLRPVFVDYFFALSRVSHNLLFISRLAYYSGMRPELFLGPQLKSITVPTLVIWGKRDPLMPYATVKDNFNFIPHVKVEVLEDVGHMPPVEAPVDFNRLAISFLGGQA